MSGKVHHRLRRNLKIEWSYQMENWVWQEPPKWQIIRWMKWLRRMPKRTW